MDAILASFSSAPANSPDYKKLVIALRNALDMNHRRIVHTARRQWEAHHRGFDESDRCVSVRVRRSVCN